MSQPSTEHPFAAYVRILGKGKTGSRSLDRGEARDAFGMILRGEVEPVQLGAFLMLLRVKEESPEEIAGFVDACRAAMLPPPDGVGADLDWSCYAGKKHQHPWFILSMLLVAGAGYRVFVHGSAGHTPGRLYTDEAMLALGLPVATAWGEVAAHLDARRLCYLPLQAFCPPLQDIMQLRPLLGLRSPVNTLARLVNPLAAPASIQSIFHPAYARIHQEADKLLGQPRAVVFKGDSGEIEVKPQAKTQLHLLAQGNTATLELPRAQSGRPEPVAAPDTKSVRALWRGDLDDAYGLQATTATAATALLALRDDLDTTGALTEAARLWRERDRGLLG